MRKKAIEHLRTDLVMGKIIDRIGPMKFRPNRLSTFQSLTQAIIHQQLSGKAAATILGRFQGIFGGDMFPEPEHVLGMAPDRLAAAGLSGAKTKYILEIARRSADGLLPSLDDCKDIKDADLIEQLTQIKGIGRWTAEMLLIFNLGRPDVLPVHDLGIRIGYQTAYRKRKLPEPKQLEKIGAVWAPYRTTASWYLWKVANFLKDGEW